MKRARIHTPHTSPSMFLRRMKTGRDRIQALEESMKLKVVHKRKEATKKAPAPAVAPIVVPAGQWQFDRADSTIEFSVMNFGVVHINGRFKDFELKVFSSAEDFSDAYVQLRIRVDSLDTGNAERDKTLLGEEWFNAEKFPTIEFDSTSLKKIDDKKYELTGNITIHGVSHTVSMNVLFNGMYTDRSPKKTFAGFTIRGTMDRGKFNLGAEPGATGVDYLVDMGADIKLVKE